jgi:hypothetical protein
MRLKLNVGGHQKADIGCEQVIRGNSVVMLEVWFWSLRFSFLSTGQELIGYLQALERIGGDRDRG